MKSPTSPKPPAGLSAEARTLWRSLTAEYLIEDRAGLLLLETAMRAHDRMQAAATLIAKHGVCVADRWGQLRSNPATMVERDSRAAMLSALKALHLDLEPVRATPGRPP